MGNETEMMLTIMGKIRHPGEEVFFEAVMSLKSQEECRVFFEDICTIKELQSLYQRFRVACLLDSGSNYLEVSDTTGASSATISRVNRCLNYGSGYRMALDNLKKAGILEDDESNLEE
jgi:TrpR-related protein YerC/YecD